MKQSPSCDTESCHLLHPLGRRANHSSPTSAWSYTSAPRTSPCHGNYVINRKKFILPIYKSRTILGLSVPNDLFPLDFCMCTFKYFLYRPLLLNVTVHKTALFVDWWRLEIKSKDAVIFEFDVPNDVFLSVWSDLYRVMPVNIFHINVKSIYIYSVIICFPRGMWPWYRKPLALC
jgi:hypothetical protein